MKSNLVNFCVPSLQGKKEVVIGSKVSQSEFDVLQSICEREDRSMSYVLRELAIRGLAYYLEDGRLKTTDKEQRIITNTSKLTLEPQETGILTANLKLGKLPSKRKTGSK